MSSISDDLDKNVARLSSFLKTILTRIPLADNDEQLVDLIAPPIQECVKVAESLNIEYPLKLTFSEDGDFEYVKLEYFPDPLVGMNFPLSRKGVLILKFEIFGASKRFYFSALETILNKTCKVWIDFLSRPEVYEGRLQYSGSNDPDPSVGTKKGRKRDPAVDQHGDEILRMADDGTPFPDIAEKLGLKIKEVRRIKGAARKRRDRIG